MRLLGDMVLLLPASTPDDFCRGAISNIWKSLRLRPNPNLLERRKLQRRVGKVVSHESKRSPTALLVLLAKKR